MFDYSLPPERIAQRPEVDRTASRMLVARGGFEGCENSSVAHLPEFLEPGDLVVINDSRVFPCRFFGRKRGGEAEIEVLLLDRDSEEPALWEALARPMKRLKPGQIVDLSRTLEAEVIARAGESGDRVKLLLRTKDPAGSEDVLEIIEREGSMPIPGYIREGRADTDDRVRYQTVFAGEAGSVAAPTAGLHFTPGLLRMLRHRGVDVRSLTLHVGPASFLPIRDLSTHSMPREWFRIPEETALAIAAAKGSGRRVLAVGTTTTRSLESAARDDVRGAAAFRSTELFITPGFEFRIVDALLTNFHQPRTTHLMLVSAFFGEARVRELYDHALESNYRFLSYGDCMLLLR